MADLRKQAENNSIMKMITGISNNSQEMPQDGAQKEKTIKSTPKTDKGQNKAKNDVVRLHYEMKQYKPTKDDYKMIPFRLTSDGAKLLKGIAQRYDTSVNNIIINALETYIRDFVSESEIKEIKKYNGIK